MNGMGGSCTPWPRLKNNRLGVDNISIDFLSLKQCLYYPPSVRVLKKQPYINKICIPASLYKSRTVVDMNQLMALLALLALFGCLSPIEIAVGAVLVQKTSGGRL